MKTSRAVVLGLAVAVLTGGGPAWSDDPAAVERVVGLRSDGMVTDVRDVIVESGKRVNHGKYYWFYDNGRVHEELNYQNGDLYGPATYRHRNGALAHKCQFVADRREGWATWWDDRGVLFREAEYKDNGLDGRSAYYYDDGRVTLVEQWKEGLKDGPWVWYHPNGKKGVEGAYSKDLQIGDWNYWNDQGDLTETRHFKDGKLLNSPKLNPADESNSGGEDLGPFGPGQ